MNFQFYLEKLRNSESYKKFIKENPDAYLCSAFFSIDKNGSDNKQHFDFFIDREIFSFQLESECELTPLKNYGEKNPEKIGENLNFDFEEIEKLIIDKLKEKNINKKIKKYLYSLQNIQGKNFLIGTIFTSELGMIKIKIDLKEMQITEFEKKSFFDMIKIFKKKD